MAALSISDALNETSAFLAREARLVLPVAFMFVALPMAILQATMPEAAPNQLPQPGFWLAVLALAIVAGLVGGVAISFLALRPGASVGEALQRGFARLLPMIGAALLVGVGLLAVFVPVAVLFGVVAAVTGNAALAVVPPLLALPLLVFVWVRMVVLNPVGAMEEPGPAGLVKRSWALTAGHFWRLLGFLVLTMLAAGILSMAISAVGGSIIVLAAGQPAPGSLSFYLVLILWTLVQTVIGSFIQVLIARIYAQLAPPDRGAIFT